MGFCGFDFGTSNTTVSCQAVRCQAAADGVPTLAPVEADHRTIPSAIFFDYAQDEILFGRAAMGAYLYGDEGRLLRAIKSILTTDLINEKTAFRRRALSFREILTIFIGHIKARAEDHRGQPLDAVVLGRPVHFVDGDPDGDRRAEQILAAVSRDAGFREVSFQFEPIAAAFAYERQIEREELALVCDLGGGTSDFSVIRLGPDRARHPDRASDVLANAGARIGGTDFDRSIGVAAVMPLLGLGLNLRGKGLSMPRWLYYDLATWAKVNFVYTPENRSFVTGLLRQTDDPRPLERLLAVFEHRLGHRLIQSVEDVKIALSGQPRAVADLGVVEAGLTVAVTEAAFAEMIAGEIARIGALIGECLGTAGLGPAAIDSVILTGGSTLVPAVRAAVQQALPGARLVDHDTFGAVGLGLGLEAARRYGGGRLV